MKNKYKLGQKVYAVKNIDWADKTVFVLHQDIVAVIQVRGGYKYEIGASILTEDLVTDKESGIKRIVKDIIAKKQDEILAKIDNGDYKLLTGEFDC